MKIVGVDARDAFARAGMLLNARRAKGDMVQAWLKGCPSFERNGDAISMEIEYRFGEWPKLMYRVASRLKKEEAHSRTQ